MKHGHGRENIQCGGVAPLRPSQITFPSSPVSSELAQRQRQKFIAC